MSRGFYRGKEPHEADAERARQWVVTTHQDGRMIAQTVPIAATVEQRIAESRGRGYTGDVCTNCHMFTLRMAGHCMVCDTCGTTTGCS